MRITKGHLAVALSNRIKMLEASAEDEWKAFDKVPLVSYSMEPIRIYDQMAEALQISPYNVAHGRIIDLRITEEVVAPGMIDSETPHGTPLSVP